MHFRSISPLAGPIVDGVLAFAAADPRMLGVTLGGSAATGTADVHSDLDLVLACHDDDHPTLLAELPAVAERLGPLLAAFTGEHVGEPRLLIALYGPPLLHVDLKLIARRDLGTRVEDGLVLWERDGAVRTAWADRPAAWPQPDPQWIEDRFWVWIHYGAGKIARGELFECLDLLALLRTAVLGPLLAVRAGERPQGVRRIERVAPEVTDALVQTLGDHSATGCAEALRAAARLYTRLRDASAQPPRRRAGAEREALAYLAAVARPTAATARS
jgi:hypothetical protein